MCSTYIAGDYLIICVRDCNRSCCPLHSNYTIDDNYNPLKQRSVFGVNGPDILLSQQRTMCSPSLVPWLSKRGRKKVPGIKRLRKRQILHTFRVNRNL